VLLQSRSTTCFHLLLYVTFLLACACNACSIASTFGAMFGQCCCFTLVCWSEHEGACAAHRLLRWRPAAGLRKARARCIAVGPHGSVRRDRQDTAITLRVHWISGVPLPTLRSALQHLLPWGPPLRLTHRSRQRCQPPDEDDTCSHPLGSLRIACPPTHDMPDLRAASDPRAGRLITSTDGPGLPARLASFINVRDSARSQNDFMPG